MFKADAGTICAALGKAVRAVHAANTIPILSCARLRVEAGVLTVSATDLDLQIDAEALVESTGPSGQVAVDARRLYAILRRLPKREAVEFVAEGERAILSWNGARVALPTRTASDFPDLTLGDARTFTAKVDDGVTSALRRVRPFISTEETRYYLTGVCLWPHGGKVSLVATDGRRLCAFPSGPTFDALAVELGSKRPIVPLAAVRLWLDFAKDADFYLQITSDGLKIALDADGLSLRSKLIDGAYPPWERVVPNPIDLRPIPVARTALLHALALVSAAQSSRDDQSCALTVAGGRAQLGAWTPDGEIAVDLGPASGAPIEFGVQARYLKGAIDAVRGDEVTIWTDQGVATQAGPLAVTGSESKPGEHVVLMPLRSVRRPEFLAPPSLAEAA